MIGIFWLNYTCIDNTCKNLLVPFDLQTLTIALRILFVVMDDALMSQIHTHVCATKATQDRHVLKKSMSAAAVRVQMGYVLMVLICLIALVIMDILVYSVKLT